MYTMPDDGGPPPTPVDDHQSLARLVVGQLSGWGGIHPSSVAVTDHSGAGGARTFKIAAPSGTQCTPPVVALHCRPRDHGEVLMRRLAASAAVIAEAGAGPQCMAQGHDWYLEAWEGVDEPDRRVMDEEGWAAAGRLLAKIHSTDSSWFEPLRTELLASDPRLSEAKLPHASHMWVYLARGSFGTTTSSWWTSSWSAEAIRAYADQGHFAPAHPVSQRLVTVHGDFHPGNMLLRADGEMLAVDFEFSCVGLAVQDLAHGVASCDSQANKLAFVRAYLAALGEPEDKLQALLVDCELAQLAGWHPDSFPGGNVPLAAWCVSGLSEEELLKVGGPVYTTQAFAAEVRASPQLQESIRKRGLKQELTRFQTVQNQHQPVSELGHVFSDLFRSDRIQFWRLMGSAALNVAHTLLGREWARQDGLLAAGVGEWWAAGRGPTTLRPTVIRIAWIVAIQVSRYVALDSVDTWLRNQFAFTQRKYRHASLASSYFARAVPHAARDGANYTLATAVKSHAELTTRICFQSLGSASRLFVWLRAGGFEAKLIRYVLGYTVVMFTVGVALTRFTANIMRLGKDSEEELHRQIGHVAENASNIVLQNDELTAASAFDKSFQLVERLTAGTVFVSVAFAEALTSAYKPLASHGGSFFSFTVAAVNTYSRGLVAGSTPFERLLITFNQIDSCRLALSDFLELFQHVPEWRADARKIQVFSGVCAQANAAASQRINSIFDGSGQRLLFTEGLSVTYESRDAPIYFPDLSIYAGQPCRILIHAPSGSGKTTCVKLLRGVNSECKMQGKFMWGLGYEDVVFVPQYPLVATGTDFESYTHGISREQMVRLQLGHLLGRESTTDWEQELSGGETARIALLHAMAKSPKFMVLDETTSSLDVGNAEAVLELLRESGTPFMLFCTDKIQTSTFPFTQSCALTAAPLELSPDVAD